MFIEIEKQNKKSLLNINHIVKITAVGESKCELEYLAYTNPYEQYAPYEINRVVIDKSYSQLRKQLQEIFKVDILL